MKKFVILISAILIITSCPLLASGETKDKPTEARVVKTYEDGKEVEYIEIKLKSGKVVKIYPHLRKEQIPVPRSELPTHISKKFLTILITIIVGLLAGIAGVWWLLRKEESP